MRCVLACLLVACGPTIVPRALDTDDEGCAACEPGPVGPPGEPGPAGPPGPAIHVWVDATGAVVSEAAEPIWIDPATGYVWTIDVNSGEYRSGSDVPLTRWYDNPACAGLAWLVAGASPRVPFRLDGPGSFYMVRPDSVTTETLVPEAFVGSTGQCTPSSWGVAVPGMLGEHTLTSTGLLDPPLSPWVGPLHRALP